DPLSNRLRLESLEKVLCVRAAGLREQDFAAQLREELRELLSVARLVEEVGTQDQIPGRVADQRLWLAPTDVGEAQEDAVALGVPPQQLDRVLCPVGCEHVGPAEGGGECRQPQAAAELDDP